jgi:hypothetical protein
VGGLVKLLGIKGSTETQGDTGAEEDVVANGSDTTVVDLGLSDGVSNHGSNTGASRPFVW